MGLDDFWLRLVFILWHQTSMRMWWNRYFLCKSAIQKIVLKNQTRWSRPSNLAIFFSKCTMIHYDTQSLLSLTFPPTYLRRIFLVRGGKRYDHPVLSPLHSSQIQSFTKVRPRTKVEWDGVPIWKVEWKCCEDSSINPTHSTDRRCGRNP